MADFRLLANILVKRGLEANLPTVLPGELALATDSHKLFVGDDDGDPVQVVTTAVTALADLTDVLLSSPGAAQALVYNGTTWANRALVISDIAALQTALNNLADDISAEASARAGADAILATAISGKQAALGFTAEDVANKDTDSAFTANSDTKYPSQKAVNTALATKQNSLGFTAEDVANKDTDVLLAANSDTKYTSQKAVKAYIDAQILAHFQALANGGTGVDLSASGGLTKLLAQDAAHVISARDLVGADLPNPSSSTKGGVMSSASAAHQFLTQIGTDGSVSKAQPNFEDLTNKATPAQAGANQSVAGVSGLLLPLDIWLAESSYPTSNLAANALWFVEIEINRYISVTGANVDLNINTGDAANGKKMYLGLYDSSGNLALEVVFTFGTGLAVVAGVLTTNPSLIVPGPYTMAFGFDISSSSVFVAGTALGNVIRIIRGTTRCLSFKSSQISGGHIPSTLPGSRSDGGSGSYPIPLVYLTA